MVLQCKVVWEMCLQLKLNFIKESVHVFRLNGLFYGFIEDVFKLFLASISP